jgi:hypothetical protein
MNIQRINRIIKLLPSVNDITYGKEFTFMEQVKKILPTTNFELLGEHLIVGKENNIGKCDMWLINQPTNFLLSLELKVGESNDSKRKKLLQSQMYKYTNFMKFYFPDNTVYGIGAYKCPNDIKFFNYDAVSITEHEDEIRRLKKAIKDNCE